MSLTIVIELYGNLDGVISVRCGFVVKFCTKTTDNLQKFSFYRLFFQMRIHFVIDCFLFSLEMIRKDNYVALKVIKSAQHYTETAADEIRLLKKIAKNESQHPWCERIVRLLNHFTIRGVNGVHTCLVFETLGCSLYKLIVKNNFQGLHIKMVKSITRQVRYPVAVPFAPFFSCCTLFLLQYTHTHTHTCRFYKVYIIYIQNVASFTLT